jgi:hypothetical protein
MTAEREARLTALGFEWNPGANCIGNPRHAVWETQLARLVAYKAEHGDCNVPQGWVKDLRLGRWVADQRKRKRKLDRGEPSEGMTAERETRLTALGFTWDGPNIGGHPKEVVWEAQLARLVAYKAEHGDCNVPQRWVEDPRLGRWVKMQRQYKKGLVRGEPREGMTAVRMARLTALGFNWKPLTGSRTSNAKQPQWDAQLARLADYKSAHGDCNVPQGWAADPGLGRWVDKQRQYKRKLDRGEPSNGMTVERAELAMDGTVI